MNTKYSIISGFDLDTHTHKYTYFFSDGVSFTKEVSLNKGTGELTNKITRNFWLESPRTATQDELDEKLKVSERRVLESTEQEKRRLKP